MKPSPRPHSRRLPLVLMLSLSGAACLPRSEAQSTPGPIVPDTSVVVSELDLSLMDQQYQSPRKDLSVSGKPLSIDGRKFATGIGTHANSRLVLRLDRAASRFQSWVGVDDNGGKDGSVRFSIRGDGKELWRSNLLRAGDPAVPVALNVAAVQFLSLHVDDGGNGNTQDHANWAEPMLKGVTKQPAVVARLPEEAKLVLPGRPWTDTEGRPIQAHGGGIMRYANRYYWYGEDRSKGYVAIGVSGYVSDDLVRWQPLGLVLPRDAYDQAHGDKTLCERPKVAFNPKTRKFVMWFHYDKSGYGDSQAGVAVADRPEGPFHYLGQHRPIPKSTFRDMNLFVDEDATAYVFYAGEENATMHIVRLNAEWTEEEKPMVEGKTWARAFVKQSREAPAPFKHGRKYYLITSGCTGWAANPAELAIADHPLGPWKTLGNPFKGPGADKTFESQSTCVLPAPGKPPGHFIYLGDRWFPKDLADSRYIWLPFEIGGRRPGIEWKDSW